jgi:hypothetical protein
VSQYPIPHRLPDCRDGHAHRRGDGLLILSNLKILVYNTMDGKLGILDGFSTSFTINQGFNMLCTSLIAHLLREQVIASSWPNPLDQDDQLPRDCDPCDPLQA